MLAGAESKPGIDLERGRCGGTAPRWVGVWTKKTAGAESAQARPGSSSPNHSSPSSSILGSPLASRLRAAISSAARRAVEISVEQPIVGL